MAGFTLEETHYRLFFEDPKYDGFEVTMRRMSVDESLSLDALRFQATSDREQIAANVREVAAILGEHLLSWNLEKNGEPVPADAKGILAQDEDVMDAIIAGYVQAVRGVPAPLGLSSSGTGPTSSDGSGSAATLSIPMEPLSQNP